MAKWQFRLDLIDVWKQADNDEITPAQLGIVVAERLRLLQKSIENTKFKDCLNYPEPMEDTILNFENIDKSASKEEQQEEFNGILDLLYDWGDMPLPTKEGEMQQKMCWIATNF